MIAAVLSLALLSQAPEPVAGREELTAFSAKRLKLHRRSMGILGGWGVANLAAGGVGWALSTDARARGFWQMTLMWGVVNAALAAGGLIAGRNDDPAALDLKASLDQGDTYQKLFLFNGGLDLAYLVAAGLLHERGARTGDPTFVGYGNALLVQGAFLLVFDLTMFFVHQHLNGQILDRLTVTPNGLGLTF